MSTIEIIRQHMPELRRDYHVTRIGLFGSAEFSPRSRMPRKARDYVLFLEDRVVTLLENPPQSIPRTP